MYNFLFWSVLFILVQNGGPRSISPNTVDSGRPPGGGGKMDMRSGSPSPSLTSEKTLSGPELMVSNMINPKSE